MTTLDPSREAFEKWIAGEYGEIVSLDRRAGGRYEDPEAGCCWLGWRAAMDHASTELEQAHEARRQAQQELTDMQEKRNRIGLDIDRALKGKINEQSPIAGRLRMIAEAAAPKQEGST